MTKSTDFSSKHFSIRKVALAAAMMAAALPVFSQAPIVDLSSSSEEQSAPAYRDAPYTPETRVAPAVTVAERPRARQGNPQADAYYQMQVLQQEVSELRGAVEELRHEVRRLKQQRTDDYMDLDRRLSRLSGTEPQGAPDSAAPAEGQNGSTNGAAPQAGQAATSTTSPATATAGASERDRYQSSFALARNGDYNGAKDAFKQFLQDYPTGQYAPNANYWLGEIALVQGDLEEARQWFVALLEDFPTSTKVWDGRYKLGTVYHQLGDQQKAKELLEQVASSEARASGKAKRYLADNF